MQSLIYLNISGREEVVGHEGVYSSTNCRPFTGGQTLNWVLKLDSLNQKIKH